MPAENQENLKNTYIICKVPESKLVRNPKSAELTCASYEYVCSMQMYIFCVVLLTFGSLLIYCRVSSKIQWLPCYTGMLVADRESKHAFKAVFSWATSNVGTCFMPTDVIGFCMLPTTKVSKIYSCFEKYYKQLVTMAFPYAEC